MGDQAAQSEAAGGLCITAMPNPASDAFTLTVASDQYREEIILQLYDVYGRVVEAGKLTAHSTLRMGDDYKQGAYYARVIQSLTQKEIKLIKLNK